MTHPGTQMDSILLGSFSGETSKCFLSHNRKLDWVPQEDL